MNSITEKKWNNNKALIAPNNICVAENLNVKYMIYVSKEMTNENF